MSSGGDFSIMTLIMKKNTKEMMMKLKSYISKKVWSLESKLWSVICSQNSRNWSLVMEADVMPRRRDNASNNSPANSFDSFMPRYHFRPTLISFRKGNYWSKTSIGHANDYSALIAFFYLIPIFLIN